MSDQVGLAPTGEKILFFHSGDLNSRLVHEIYTQITRTHIRKVKEEENWVKISVGLSPTRFDQRQESPNCERGAKKFSPPFPGFELGPVHEVAIG